MSYLCQQICETKLIHREAFEIMDFLGVDGKVSFMQLKMYFVCELTERVWKAQT